MSLSGNLSAENIIIGSIGNIHITDEALQEIVNEITAQLIDNENVRQETFETNESTRQETFDTNEAQRQAEFKANEAARHIIVDHRNIIPDDVEIYTDESGNQTPYTINAQGEIVEDTIYNTAAIYGFIDVKPNTLYSSCCAFVVLAEYRADDTFIKHNWSTKVGSMWQFTTSAECEKIKFSRLKVDGTRYEKDLCIFEGAYTTRPEHQGHTHMANVIISEENIYPQSVAAEKVDYNAIQEEHCDFIETNKNLLRDVDWQVGICQPYGYFLDGDDWQNSSFVSVRPLTEYVLGFATNVTVIAFNRNKIPCGDNETGVTTITNGVFTTPEDCYYVVVTTQSTNIEKTTMFLSTANTAEVNTFTMPNLKIGTNNLGSDILSSVKSPTSSILADLIFATETKKIKLIGDSITHGMGSSDFVASTDESDYLYSVYSTDCYRNYGVKCWAGMLKTYLENKFDCSVTNNGASGSKVEHLVANWDSIVSADDDIIICMIGTNDRGNSLSTIYQSVVALYKKAQANNQKIIFMSAPPTSIENETQFTACHMEDIDNLYNYVNSALNVGYISIYKSFLNYCREHNITIDSLLADGLHPNDTGYQLMFEIVLEALGFGRKRDGANW